MLRKTALAAAAALTAISLFCAIPAEAQYWHHPGPWHHHPHWGPGPGPFFYGFPPPPPPDCYWTTRRVRVWTDDGPRWVRQQVRVCD